MLYSKLVPIGLVAVLIIGIITALHFKIKNKDIEIATLNATLSAREVTITKLESSNREYKVLVGIQNEAVEKLAIDTSLANQKLKGWKALPKEVRYEVIYKTNEVKSNECEDIKSTIDNIRHLDYSRL